MRYAMPVASSILEKKIKKYKRVIKPPVRKNRRFNGFPVFSGFLRSNSLSDPTYEPDRTPFGSRFDRFDRPVRSGF
ncbi:unnamed protein product [Trifolium pratense]|uniref:Uncharacterized protein n=1 Tax=Trifolium pratense TaxID=57577 RepID=A0ACB0JJ93_TRIPR|nr:unnamed protein product [Trifolium pratense]